ncbi:MAG TPA: glycosyltransferase family 4 protein [Acidimicrobiia bacterium]
MSAAPESLGARTHSGGGTTRPHLCVIAHSAELYGADKCLHAALPELLERFKVTVLVPADGPGIAVMQDLGASVLRLPDYALRRRHLTARGLLPWLGRLRSSSRTVRDLHEREPIAVLYSNTLAAGLGPIVARRLDLPHAVHVHECPTSPSWFPKAVFASLDGCTQRVICNSHYTAHWVTTVRGRLADRTVVVHNGLDLPPAPAAPPSSGPRLRISCVARIHPKKGQMVLLEALSRAYRDGREWLVDFFGDTLPEHQPLHRELEQFAAQHQLQDALVWHGFVDDLQVQYADADVAVVPSVVPEEFSLVCLEAQSLMVPVVATGPGGASEVVVDGITGMIVPPTDADALYRALATLDDDPARRRDMGIAGRKHVETAFSRERFANGVADELDALVGTAARRAA